MSRILIADDEPGIREFLVDSLELGGHDVTAVGDGVAAIAALNARAFELVLTDLNMPGGSGLDVVRFVAGNQPEVQTIVLTGYGTVENAVAAMKLGAYDFLQKPVESPDALLALVARALERRTLLDTAARARIGERVGPPLSHGDPAMTPVTTAIDKVAPTMATVLLLGESGTGKEVAARAIHAASARSERPYVALNCAALTETLLASELFGHEKGAFTGADERRRGRIELAAGGTFFLDEVGELKPELQAKLLRVLQEKSFERVGGSQTIQSDVRWIAATNRDLKAMIAEGSFREDLYHRLAVFPIELPPLRARRSDILPIAGRLLVDIGRELGVGALELGDDARTAIAMAPWPGNVRELRNALERAAILAGGGLVTLEHLAIEHVAEPIEATGDVITLAEAERRAIARALLAVDGNRRKAAEALAIAERTLYDKIRKYGL